MASLDSTMGAAYIGVVIAAVLYGVSCVQLLHYYLRYDKDWWYVKALVVAVWLSDSIHQALISHTVYTYVITFADGSKELGNLVWSLIVEVLFNGITAFLVQSFFTFRIWKLSKGSVLLTSLVYVLVLGEFGSVIAYVAQAIRLQTFEQLGHMKGLSMTVNSLAAAGDVLIALILCTILQQSRTGFKSCSSSDGLITKLILCTVNTGFLTSLCAVASLIAITVVPNTFVYICFYFTLGRLYTNSLLATLNARKLLRKSGSFPLQEIQLSGSGATAHQYHPSRGHIAVKVNTTKEYNHDSIGDNDLDNANEPSVEIEAKI